MKLVYNNKSINLVCCTSFFSRFMGFMGKKNIDYALYFGHCNSIHTFFMRENIDVIMCDRDDTILYYYKDLKPNRIILPKRGVFGVYETPSLYFDLKVGDKLKKES